MDDSLALVGRAEEGDDDALAELQHQLDHDEALWQPREIICRMVKRHLVDLAAADSRVKQGHYAAFVMNVRRDFLDGDGDPLEAFLTHRIVVAYLVLTILQKLRCGRWQRRRAAPP